jgi:hypothetical protein
MPAEPVFQLLFLQVFLPLAFIILNTILPTGSITGLLARFLAIGALLSYLSLAGVWLFPPSWSMSLLAFLHAGGTLIVFVRYCRKQPGRTPWRNWGERLVAGAIAAAMLGCLASISAGRVTPPGAVDLAPPLAPGRYLVVSGGNALGLNAHLITLRDERYHAVRGQSFAIDVIGVDEFGFRAEGVAPKDPRKYRIYGVAILAPCAGTIVSVADGFPDMPVPQHDRTHLAGNHILLDCGDYVVALAHMAPGSISVKPGEVVDSGRPVGRVGNSGKTDEPHLHMHVQRNIPEASPLGGDPLWFTIDGRFLARNDNLRFQ